MPNNRLGNYSIKVECGEHEITTAKPIDTGNNDQDYMTGKLKEFEFEYVSIIDENNSIDDEVEKNAWIMQLPDVVVT